jgi:hypothetical protein
MRPGEIALPEGGFSGKCQEMAQKAHGKAQAQQEAQAYTVATSKDGTLVLKTIGSGQKGMAILYLARVH